MEKITASSRPAHESYKRVALSDAASDGDMAELETSSEDTIAAGWMPGHRQRHPRTLLSTLWLCLRFIFIVGSIFAWGVSLWLTHRATVEIERARTLLPVPSSAAAKPGGHNQGSLASHDSSGGGSSSYKSTGPHHDALDSMFIPGGALPVAGYGLVYNTTYCNGWEDPEGAKARGCVLDPSQGGWVHELCHDPDLLEEWMQLPDFGWYLDPKKEIRISQDDVWAANIPNGVSTTLYTAQDFHIKHCTFVMRLRILHTTRRHRGLGYITLDPAHMKHCVELMTEDVNPKELTQVVLGNFGGGAYDFGLAGECYMPIL
ncbi:hypothetical protein F5Y16DRAFT_424426 [Xylariaceae sp. FL0255]|nr:hypothetical protein F5Y16DRAFT_424426 [Xylariaceae sp. FL0255]